MEYSSDLRAGTTVTFAGGSLSEEATVGFVTQQDGQTAVVTDKTPFHPISATWPDQPADHGWLTGPDGVRVPVTDCLEATLNCVTGALFTGQDARNLPRADPDLCAVVLHMLAADGAAPMTGQNVLLEVDAPRRAALSVQHTGVHLAALALNQITDDFWTKDYADLDSAGFKNFDKAAVTGSQITPDHSVDVYRIGKSLRKKGFDRATFLTDLPARSVALNACLHEMLAHPAPVTVTPPQGQLSARRLWATTLQGRDVSIFCGGTHVSNLSDITTITVELTPSDEGFTMTTKTSAA